MRIKLQSMALACVLLLLSVSAVWAQSSDGPTPQIIVKWRQPNGQSAQARALGDREARFGLRMKWLRSLAVGGEVMRMNRRMSDAEMQRMLADLASDPMVEYVEMDRLLQPMAIPNDTQFNQQWYSFEPQGGLNLPSVWDAFNGQGIRVALLDTGVLPHADLGTNVERGFDFISDPFIANDSDGRDGDPTDSGTATAAGVCGPGTPAVNSSWHGTFLAGLIAALANNNNGVAGTAFGAKVLSTRVFGRCGALLSDVVDAGLWAVGITVPNTPINYVPAKVLNIALAAPGPCDMTAQAAINAIRARGAAIVVAAGNTSSDVAGTMPANCANVITVGATARDGTRAFYSNFGAGIDVSAPGGDLRAGPAGGAVSTHNNGTITPGMDTIAVGQGTSVATALTSGVVALLMSTYNLRADQIEDLLKSTARPFPAPCNGCGAGIVDAAAAARAAAMLPPRAGLHGALNELQPAVNTVRAAGWYPTVYSNSAGDIVEYRLRRTKSTGEPAEEYRDTSGHFFDLPKMGCVGETMVFTLTVVDRLGRTSSFAQNVTFEFSPYLDSTLPCGK